MAARLIQNSFVAGELAPDLYGRSDLKPYFQAAARIVNFVVKRTGGLRKRPGTQLVKRIDAAGSPPSAEFRLFPVFVRRNVWAAILLYRKAGSQTIFYRTYIDLAGASWSGERSVAATQFPDTNALAELRAKQIGDTIYFSRRGMRTFKARMSYSGSDAPTASWSTIKDVINVKKPAFSSLTRVWDPEGGDSSTSPWKDSTKGYLPKKRKYGLFGVKSGVFSEAREKEVTIWLQWTAGAYILLKFVPDFSRHDYYVLALQQGADWGVLATYFPSLNAGAATDVTAWANSGASASGTVNGTAYLAGLTNPNTALRAANPNETTTSGNITYHTNALLVTGTLTATYKSATAPVLAVKIHFGARLRKADNSGADNVGTPGTTTVTLKNGTTTLQTWSVNAAYSSDEQTLVVDNPRAGTSSTYTLTFTPETSGTPVVVRGVTLVSDAAEREYKDEYYAPGSVTGLQERLTVGDAGMDCAIVDVWQQRLMMASSGNLPFTLWFSQVNDLENFYATRPQTASDAFSATIPATKSSKILHTLSGRRLMLFTENGEFEVSDTGNSGFSFASISIRQTSNVGAHGGVPPEVADERALFVAADGRSVFDLGYSLEQDNMVPTNRSLFAQHLTESATIVKTAYQRHPDSILWCLLSDGTLLSLTYLPGQDVCAWARHRLAGGAGLKVVDMCATGTTETHDGCDPTDVILLTLTSEADPASVWVERLRAPSASDTPATAAATCHDHMGYGSADRPSGGDPEAPVDASFATLPADGEGAVAMGMNKQVFDCCLRLNRSGTVEARPLGSGLDWQTTREPPEVSGGSVALKSGVAKVLPRAWSGETGQMEVRSADDWPCEVLALCQKIEAATEEEGE